MKNFTGISFWMIFVLSAIVFLSCSGGAPARNNETGRNAVTAANETERNSDSKGGNSVTELKDAEGKEWILSEITGDGKTVVIDRKKLEADGMGGFFTIGFFEGRVSGMAAPNRFLGPYTAGGGKALSIGNLASTMMAAFREPEELNEREYFDYLAGVTRWDVRGGKLELYTANNNKTETVLAFTQK